MKLLLTSFSLFALLPSVFAGEASGASLSPTDYVGISFWLATAIMLSCIFFLLSVTVFKENGKLR